MNTERRAVERDPSVWLLMADDSRTVSPVIRSKLHNYDSDLKRAPSSYSHLARSDSNFGWMNEMVGRLMISLECEWNDLGAVKKSTNFAYA